MRRVLVQVVQHIGIVTPVCKHMLGQSHSPTHRMVVGVGLMVIGVQCAKVAGHVDIYVLQLIGDGIGYALHGLGLTPFIEHLAYKMRNY